MSDLIKMGFVIRTDVHISDRAPASRCDDYTQTCIDKLKQISDIAREREAYAVLDNGDFFHNKSASRNSHLLVRRVADLHRTYPCPVYCNPGNHDFPYANVDYIHQQPLGVLFSTGVFERMTDHTFTVTESGGMGAGPHSALNVRVVGLPYKVKFDVEEWDIERGDEDILIVCAHTFASLEGGQWFGKEKVQSYHELAECSPDVFIFGHWHIDQGVEDVRGKVFYNLGSMTRGSLTEDNLERTPRVGWLQITKDPVTGEVKLVTEAIPLKVRPANEVFDLATHEQLQEEQRNIEHFLDQLAAQTVDMEESDMRSTVEAMKGFEVKVREKALRYLDKAAP